MESRIEQLKEEITSILEQYRAEVSGRRKPWPNAIKKRVLELTQLGVPQIQLVHLTGISYMTILEWRKSAGMKISRKNRKKKFHALTVKAGSPTVVDKSSPKTVLPQTVLGQGQPQAVLPQTVVGSASESKIGTVVITTPEGLRVELSSLDQAVEFTKRIRG